MFAQAKAQVNIGVGSQVKGVIQVGGRGRSKNPYFLGPFLFPHGKQVFRSIFLASQVKGGVQVGSRRSMGKYPYFLGPFLFLCSDEVFWVK